MAFVTPAQEFGGGTWEWSTFSCRGVFVQTQTHVGAHFAGPLNQRGHVGRLFSPTTESLEGHPLLPAPFPPVNASAEDSHGCFAAWTLSDPSASPAPTSLALGFLPVMPTHSNARLNT